MSEIFTYSYIEDTVYFYPNSNLSYKEENKVDLFTISDKEFREIIENDIRNDKRVSYILSDDPRMTKNSYIIYLILIDHIKAYEKGVMPYNKKEEEFIDIYQIPQEWEHLYYQYIYLKENYEKNTRKNFE